MFETAIRPRQRTPFVVRKGPSYCSVKAYRGDDPATALIEAARVSGQCTITCRTEQDLRQLRDHAAPAPR